MHKGEITSAIIALVLIVLGAVAVGYPLITGYAAGDPIEDDEAGLVALWHLNEGGGSTVSDSSGNGNTGTLINGTTWVDGKFGKALSFDGVNDYVEVANSASLDLTGNEITMEAWVYGSFPTNYKRYVVINKYKRSVGGYGLIIYRHSSPSGNARAYLNTDTGRSEGFCIGVVSQNNWTHIAFTWNSPNGSLYINGVKKSDCELNGSIASYSDRALWIGKRGGASSADVYFNGIIDEVAIYNRALSASEIKNHYDKGMGEEPPPSPECGNNVKETGEECDGTDDSSCPGECQSDCTCYVAPPPGPECGNNDN